MVIGQTFIAEATRSPDVTSEWNPQNVFDVLGSEEVRRILAFADDGPVSAQELADRLDASQPTIYRRINVCEEYDLLTEATRVDDEGNHRKVYQTNLQRACIEVADGGYDVTISLRHDLVDGVGDHRGDSERDGDG